MMDRPDDTIMTNQAPLPPRLRLDVPQSRTFPDGSALIITSDAITLVEAPDPYSVSLCSTDSSPVNPTS